jgi:hypothetical protein
MNNIYRVLKRERNEYVAIVLMVLYIVSNAGVPEFLGSMIDTMVGRVVVFLFAASLLYVHKVLGVVALVFAYELIKRSERSTGTYQLRHHVPSEAKKNKHLNAMNQFPITLEEEMVQKLVPLVSSSAHDTANADYKPVMNGLHGAASLL